MTGDETGKKGKESTKGVPFNAEQLAEIGRMMEARDRMNSRSSGAVSPNNAISMYNVRDPKTIESISVSRFDGEWVLGFKDFNKDPYKKIPNYNEYGPIPERGLKNEPFVTLILSKDGKTKTEKKVSHIDYMTFRDKKNIKVVKMNEQTIITDHGVLGTNSQFAIAVNDTTDKFETRPTILAQTKEVIRTFDVELPMFDDAGEETGTFPYTFSTDFLG